MTAADMMMARDATARAFNAMVAAEARAADDVASVEACVEVSKARKAWVKAVKSAEKVQRAVWAAEDKA